MWKNEKKIHNEMHVKNVHNIVDNVDNFLF